MELLWPFSGHPEGQGWKRCNLLPAQKHVLAILARVIPATFPCKQFGQLPPCGFIYVSPKLFGWEATFTNVLEQMYFGHDVECCAVIPDCMIF